MPRGVDRAEKRGHGEPPAYASHGWSGGAETALRPARQSPGPCHRGDRAYAGVPISDKAVKKRRTQRGYGIC